MDYEARRTRCVVVVKGKVTRHVCGEARRSWTNHMEPLCMKHSHQRMAVQGLMVWFLGKSWGAIVVANNPEGFKNLRGD